MRNFLKRTSTLTMATALLLPAMTTAANAKATDELKPQNKVFQQAKVSKNTSQLLRSNAAHYWSYVRDQGQIKELQPYLSAQGVVVGDPHLGNFSVIPVKSQQTQQVEMRYLNIDFDDAGTAPFAFDFIRAAIVTKGSENEAKYEEMVDAYLKGLKDKPFPTPTFVQEALGTSMGEYEKLVEKYVEGKTKGDVFEFETGVIEKAPGPMSLSAIAQVFPSATLLDVGIRPQVRGGSKGSVRLWVLLRENGKKRIFELKAYKPSSLSQYQPQPSRDQWLSSVRDAFWSGIDGRSYDLVQTSTGEVFWKREKKVNIFELPENSKSGMKEAALFMFYSLGRLHAQQGGEVASYASLIERNPEAFRNAFKPMVKAYLEFAEKTLDKN